MINKTKRLMISRSVKIPRKTFFWGASPRPGKHNRKDSMAILTALRDYLKVGDKEREVTRILVNNLVKVDGKIVKDRRFPVGFMDLITLEKVGRSFRVLYDRKGGLVLGEESKENSDKKLMKVMDKRTVKGGKSQLNFHDGQMIITDNKEVKPGDVVLVTVPDKKIQEVMKLQPGNKVFLTGGSHAGNIATIKKIEIKESSHKNLIHFEEGYSTITDYAFVVSGSKYTYEVPAIGGALKDE